jgi:hypothetical protein
MTPRPETMLLFVLSLLAFADSASAQPLPSVQEMAASRRDVWGEAALRQPDGPSYEFFKDLLPPLRYVNTAFRHYPIVLSAPGAAMKARWVSNGSAVNARADKKPMWHEVGFPVHFRVGEGAEAFGEDLERLKGPGYAEGYLPIVRSTYACGSARYEQEAFAAVRGPLSESGAVFLRFTVRDAGGTVRAHLDCPERLTVVERSLRNEGGQALLAFGEGWSWDGEKKDLQIRLASGRAAELLIFTQPLQSPPPHLTPARYEAERKECVECWEGLLRRGMTLDVPEPIVNDAWRSLVIGNFMIAVGDRMHYSAGNAYDHLYEAECGDATRALLLYGFTEDARRMVGPLLDFQRQATRYHVAGHKLQLLAHYYLVTRDAAYLRDRERVWKTVVDFVLNERQKSNGLMPPDRYAGDINRPVLSLNSNANCWRGLCDMAVVLADLGEQSLAERLAREAGRFREAILQAVAKSERRDVRPPFIPMSLLGDEGPYETLTASRQGSYYDLMAPYVLGAEVFPSGSERETWMIDYLREHGGLAMGMIRSTPHQGEFDNQPGVNVLYGLRYQLTLLRRDDREHALAGFYGHLAQGMTRETFIGGEGSRFLHGDPRGRSFYLPPNSASNAMLLTTLRYLLLQDWQDDAGKPSVLRLLYGVPGRWLKDGATLKVGRAPTLFGPISFQVESHLSQGEVLMHIESPPRRPEQWSLRLPLPSGWKVTAARVGDTPLALARDGAVDLSAHSGPLTLRFRVERATADPRSGKD